MVCVCVDGVVQCVFMVLWCVCVFMVLWCVCVLAVLCSVFTVLWCVCSQCCGVGGCSRWCLCVELLITLRTCVHATLCVYIYIYICIDLLCHTEETTR